MVYPIGFRFCPTDLEIVNHYLRLKNLGDTPSHFDQVMNTLNIYSFDPWDLPSQSRFKWEDKVWYFFNHKENKDKKTERQSRKTKSGYWKKTGVTLDIMSKNCPRTREKIGEKRVLVFHSNKNLKGSKSDWVMHEFHFVSSFPNQMITYTICRVQFKGEASNITSSSSEIHHTYSSTTHMNNFEGLPSAYEGSSFDQLHNQELQNSRPLSGLIDVEQETQLKDAIHKAFDNLSSSDWESLLNICNNKKPQV